MEDHFQIPQVYFLYILPWLNAHLLDATNYHEILSLTVNGPSFNSHLNA